VFNGASWQNVVESGKMEEANSHLGTPLHVTKFSHFLHFIVHLPSSVLWLNMLVQHCA
jgi:hypothetical protein